jgi:hypothetical protein
VLHSSQASAARLVAMVAMAQVEAEAVTDSLGKEQDKRPSRHNPREIPS